VRARLLSPPLSRCCLPSLTGAELTAWLPAQGAGARADRKAGGGARVLGAAARDPGGAEPAAPQEEDEPGGGERWRIARGAPYVDGAARSPCRLLP